jgi:hypothetical protein
MGNLFPFHYVPAEYDDVLLIKRELSYARIYRIRLKMDVSQKIH